MQGADMHVALLAFAQQWDATHLASTYTGPSAEILIDQGSADDFLGKGQLLPENLQRAVAARAQAESKLTVDYRLQDGYDHSYYFITTFIDDHIAFHAKHLHAKQ
jgi:S-formylglutathione hydrolase